MKPATFLLSTLLILAGLAAGTTALAQPDPQKPPSPDPRNIEGVWFKAATYDDPKSRAKTGDSIARPPLPPMSDEAKALYDARDAARKAGHPLFDPEVKCIPPGVPRVEFQPYPIQIIQTPTITAIVHEENRSNRLIYMDLDHPATPQPPAWLGYSVGHWDGDTLVVDTVGQRPESLMYPALAMTDKTHVVERWRKIDGGKKLEDVYTIDDPKLYPTPWTARFEFLWWPKTRITEYVCEEADHPEDETAKAFH